jgi:hypothetical protein
MERLDPRAVKRVSGPSWGKMRPLFDRINSSLLGVSPTVRGELTTIYIKYFEPQLPNRPYAVLWIKKSTLLVLGLSLPEIVESPRLAGPPSHLKYAGITKYMTVEPGQDVPEELAVWATLAHDYRIKGAS